jgi:hypothetical protein
MHWVRKNGRFCSWAAIFALTIQLVLSFGHIHLEDVEGSSAVITATSQVQSNTPADDDRGSSGHDFCAICATLNLTSSSVLPAVTLPTTPVDHPHKWFAHLHPAQVSYSVHFLYQSRGPPRSI